jgi:hypothetical protein
MVGHREGGNGKATGTDDAADGGNREETSPRRIDGRSYATLRINLSHDLPHSLGQARRGVDSTAAGRLFFKLEKRNTR